MHRHSRDIDGPPAYRPLTGGWVPLDRRDPWTRSACRAAVAAPRRLARAMAGEVPPPVGPPPGDGARARRARWGTPERHVAALLLAEPAHALRFPVLAPWGALAPELDQERERRSE